MIKKDKSFIGNEPILYLLATPIGNLKDFTFRAIEILNDSDIIACEDTRNTKKLLSFYNINKQLFSLHEHNEISASLNLIKKIKQGQKVVYVSDAGYPLISDPGQLLVKECMKEDIKVSCIPGANAMLMGLVGSNIKTDHFYFYGFLSSKKSEKEKELKQLVNFKDTIIFYESPHRIKDTLSLISEYMPNRQLCICRELSKLHEEYIRLNTDEIDKLDFESLIGEMVLILQGNETTKTIDDETLRSLIVDELKTTSLKDKELANKIAMTYDVSKNKVYDMILSIKRRK